MIFVSFTELSLKNILKDLESNLGVSIYKNKRYLFAEFLNLSKKFVLYA